jgi:phage tail-like protein
MAKDDAIATGGNAAAGPDEGFHHTDTFHNAFCFEVKIAGISEENVNQAFTRVSGIVSQSEMMEFMQGTDPFVRKSPGRVTFEDISLERIWNGSDAFYHWRRAIETGGTQTRDVSVIMKTRGLTEVRVMTLVEAWPSRWELPELDASGAGAATERITLTVLNVIEGTPAES